MPPMPPGFGPVVRELPDHSEPVAFVAAVDDALVHVACPPLDRVTTVPHEAGRLGAVDLKSAALLVAVTEDHRVEAWDLRTSKKLRPTSGATLPYDARLVLDAPDWVDWVTQDGMCVTPGERGLLVWHVPVVVEGGADGVWVQGILVDVDAELGTFGIAAAWKFFEPVSGLECPTLDGGRGLLHAVHAIEVPGGDDDEADYELVTIRLDTGERHSTAIPVPKSADVDWLEIDAATGRVTAVSSW